MKLLSVLILSLISFGGLAQTSQYTMVATTWKGTTTGTDKPIKLVFHIKYENKILSATMDLPDQNAFGLKVDEVSFKDGDLILRSKIVQGHFEGTYMQNRVEGSWTQKGKTSKLVVKRKKSRTTS